MQLKNNGVCDVYAIIILDRQYLFASCMILVWYIGRKVSGLFRSSCVISKHLLINFLINCYLQNLIKYFNYCFDHNGNLESSSKKKKKKPQKNFLKNICLFIVNGHLISTTL